MQFTSYSFWPPLQPVGRILWDRYFRQGLSDLEVKWVTSAGQFEVVLGPNAKSWSLSTGIFFRVDANLNPSPEKWLSAPITFKPVLTLGLLHKTVQLTKRQFITHTECTSSGRTYWKADGCPCIQVTSSRLLKPKFHYHTIKPKLNDIQQLLIVHNQPSTCFGPT